MSIKSIIKKWLGLQADIDEAVRVTREQVTRELTEKFTSEKEAAIRSKDNTLAQISQAYGEKEASLKRELADVREQAAKEQKAYAALQARLDKYRQVAEKMKVQHDGPGRPAVDRIRFNFQLDKQLKETIALLESAGIIKRGAVTEHIHADLYKWLSPLREELERTLPFDGDSVITADGTSGPQPVITTYQPEEGQEGSQF